MTKPVVTASFNDGTGARCVDIVRRPDGGYVFRECRRDPEDPHGWRALGSDAEPLATEAEAIAAARSAIGWFGKG